MVQTDTQSDKKGVDVSGERPTSASGENDVEIVTKTMNISLWDFAGHPQYLYSNYFFLHDSAIVMLTFNMATYSDHDFAKTIGQWLDWVVAKTNKLILLPVGTMADQVTSSQAAEICQSVTHLIEVHMREYKESISRAMTRIESMPHISTALSDQLKAYIHLLKIQTHVADAVVAVSAQEYTGISELLSALESMALQNGVFPNVMRTIPSLWTEVAALSSITCTFSFNLYNIFFVWLRSCVSSYKADMTIMKYTFAATVD